MKTIILIIFLSGGTFNVFSLLAEKEGTASAVSYSAITDTINQTIEGILRPLIPENISIDGPIPFSLSDESLNGTLSLHHISIAGLSDFLVPFMDERGLIPVTLKLILVVPVLQVDAGYYTNMVIANTVNIYGNGQVRILIENIQITLGTEANILTSPIQLNNTRIEMKVKAVSISITGLLNDDRFSSTASSVATDVANDLFVSYLNSNVQEVTDLISPPIQDLLNQIVEGLLGGGASINLSSTKQEFAKVAEEFVSMLKQNSV